MKERNLAEELFTIDDTVFGSQEWTDLEKREFSMGPDSLLDEIIEKDEWSNVEMLWIIKKMVYHYGKKGQLMKNIPTERLFSNIVDILRVLYLVLDHANPDLDVNIRKYLSVKLADSTWGINSRTREYLYKLGEKQQ
ncbi:hypothetical protein ASZ90_018831 [hydrocarbon metagenome]|uniref:Uncharacterized protein n=1 Tax=hydrocarbon metagenome TaxID=938273 RepID=A0A0W8E604_9ZZZZ